jgi:hypothetical protein
MLDKKAAISCPTALRLEQFEPLSRLHSLTSLIDHGGREFLAFPINRLDDILTPPFQESFPIKVTHGCIP